MVGHQIPARVQVTDGGPHSVCMQIGSLCQKPQTLKLGEVNLKIVPGSDPLQVPLTFEALAEQQAVEATRERMRKAAQSGGK